MSHKDYLAIGIIKDSLSHRKAYCTIPVSKTTQQILRILIELKKLAIFPHLTLNHTADKKCQLLLKYDSNLFPLIKELKIISTPTRRTYATKEQLYMNYSNVTTIVSTSRGILLATEAVRLNLGGEVLFIFKQ